MAYSRLSLYTQDGGEKSTLTATARVSADRGSYKFNLEGWWQ